MKHEQNNKKEVEAMLPHKHHKPPHEEILERLDRIEETLERLVEKI